MRKISGKSTETYRLFACAAMMAVLLTSALFLMGLIPLGIVQLIYIGFIAVMYTTVLMSWNLKGVLIKWLLSLPMAWICMEYFWNTHYAIRSVNWIDPEYGRVTGGAAAADGFMMLILLFCCLFGIGVAASETGESDPERYEKIEKLQIKLGGVLTILHIILVFVLEAQFPKMTDLMG